MRSETFNRPCQKLHLSQSSCQLGAPLLLTPARKAALLQEGGAACLVEPGLAGGVGIVAIEGCAPQKLLQCAHHGRPTSWRASVTANGPGYWQPAFHKWKFIIWDLSCM